MLAANSLRNIDCQSDQSNITESSSCWLRRWGVIGTVIAIIFPSRISIHKFDKGTFFISIILCLLRESQRLHSLHGHLIISFTVWNTLVLSLWNLVVVFGRKQFCDYCWNLHGIHKLQITICQWAASPTVGLSPGWSYSGVGHVLTDVSLSLQATTCDMVRRWAYNHINFDLQQDLPPPLMLWKTSSCKSSVALLLVPFFIHCKSCWLAAAVMIP